MGARRLLHSDGTSIAAAGCGGRVWPRKRAGGGSWGGDWQTHTLGTPSTNPVHPPGRRVPAHAARTPARPSLVGELKAASTAAPRQDPPTHSGGRGDKRG